VLNGLATCSGTNFSVAITDSCGNVARSLWFSPELIHYPFDGISILNVIMMILSTELIAVCNTCYSPPQNVNVPAGTFSIPVTNPTSIALEFQNNNRNIQLLLPQPMTVYWD
jgi:hypothetical protein